MITIDNRPILEANELPTQLVVNTTRHSDGYRISFDSVIFVDEATATAFVSLFSKSRGAFTSTLTWWGDDDERRCNPIASFKPIVLKPSAAAGTKNESGARRLRAIIADLEKHGVQVVDGHRFSNSVTLAEALANN